MLKLEKKPSRKELLKVISELQDLIGAAQAHHGNDRNSFGFELGQRALAKALGRCIEARAFNPPD